MSVDAVEVVLDGGILVVCDSLGIYVSRAWREWLLEVCEMRVESEVVSAFYRRQKEESRPTTVAPTSVTGLDRETCSPKQLVQPVVRICLCCISFPSYKKSRQVWGISSLLPAILSPYPSML